jgi:hypothetical protein
VLLNLTLERSRDNLNFRVWRWIGWIRSTLTDGKRRQMAGFGGLVGKHGDNTVGGSTTNCATSGFVVAVGVC